MERGDSMRWIAAVVKLFGKGELPAATMAGGMMEDDEWRGREGKARKLGDE